MTLVDYEVSIAPWHRADAYLSRRWPADVLPPEWFVLDEHAERRFSWAVRRFGACTVGRITLRPFITDALYSAAWIGLYLPPHVRGAGLGSVALCNFLEVIPRSYNLRYLHADIHSDNEHSFHLFTKYGFEVYGSQVRLFDNKPQVFTLLEYEV